MALTGGQDWFEFGELLIDVSMWYFMILLFYLCFVVFGILNIITSIFVTGAYEISQMDKDLVIQAEIQKEDSYIYGLRSAFMECDTNGDGLLTWTEFQEKIQSRKVIAYFSTLGIDATQASGLFRLIDLDGSGVVGCEEFVIGCMRLKGGAKTVDVATLMYQNRQMVSRLMKCFREVDARIGQLEDNVLRSRNPDAAAAAVETSAHQIY
eukprot:gnl/TRDRNA2_/TRDRNA2_171393_c0_seq2.p1 gnl/TRDRNA2_/TRDRNA2_171393_c0~~gnl/TRDRNA2_/TRDRNA2_171393_c0_seq2.p1  ORF type:complete len:209 (+),score=36.01 gnl/TRDRNA2_/TRDRNA2_171393_c0_seq2:30-656(+)